MNIFQRLNAGATFCIISSLIAGLVVPLSSNNDLVIKFFWDNSEISLLSIFILFFRIKIQFDDHKHFGESSQGKNKYRWWGLFIAFLSWVFMTLAGYFIHSPEKASELLFLSILISTAWISVHLVEISKDPEKKVKDEAIAVMREKWVLLNVVYMFCLVSYLGFLSPVIAPNSVHFLVAVVVFLVFDIFTARLSKSS